MRAVPIVHWVSGRSRIWPSVSDLSNFFPAARGPLHRFAFRAHNHTHAAFPLSGSCSSGRHHRHPHDQMEPRWSSAATAFAESAYHFVTRIHATVGLSPL